MNIQLIKYFFLKKSKLIRQEEEKKQSEKYQKNLRVENFFLRKKKK